MAASALLRQLHDQVAPVTLSAEQLLPVPEALQPLFAAGGLARGVSVGFQGTGSWSVALSLAAAVLGSDGWLAVLGMEELGLMAAAELGIRLDRMLLVSSVGAAQLGVVVAALMEAIDVVMLAPRSAVGLRDARRLTARARERGTVLFHLDGGRHWPEPLDLTIGATTGCWEGLGQGHGHLQRRHLHLTAVGRRAASQPRQASVMIGEPGGLQPAPVEPTDRPLLAPVGSDSQPLGPVEPDHSPLLAPIEPDHSSLATRVRPGPGPLRLVASREG